MTRAGINGWAKRAVRPTLMVSALAGGGWVGAQGYDQSQRLSTVEAIQGRDHEVFSTKAECAAVYRTIERQVDARPVEELNVLVGDLRVLTREMSLQMKQLQRQTDKLEFSARQQDEE